MSRKNTEESFWARVGVATERGCQEWQGGATRTRFGYGSLRWRGQGERLAHRVAWTLARGAIPSGMDVLHRCDNPLCCNPDHLFIGTVVDNARDRDWKHVGALRTRAVEVTP